MTIYEQILAGLQTKFTGADAATLQRIASKKSEGVTDESKVNFIVEGISFMDVLNNYGDFRADGAQKTAVKNYESKYNIKDGKPVENPEPKPKEGAKEEPTLEERIAAAVSTALGSALKPINQRFEQMDMQAKADSWAAQIAAKAKEYSIPDFMMKDRTIKEGTDLNQYFADLKQEAADAGFQTSVPPDAGELQFKTEVQSIADQINQETKELTEKK